MRHLLILNGFDPAKPYLSLPLVFNPSHIALIVPILETQGVDRSDVYLVGRDKPIAVLESSDEIIDRMYAALELKGDADDSEEL
jgi:hypothetical protein